MHIEWDPYFVVKPSPALNVVLKNRLFKTLHHGNVLQLPKDRQGFLDVDQRTVEIVLDPEIWWRDLLDSL